MTILPSFKAWFDQRAGEFDALAFDVDGVLLLDGHPVPGAPEFIACLRARGIPFGLLTNDGDRSIPEKLALLRNCGYVFREDELTSCADGLVDLVCERGIADALVFVAGAMGNPSYARKAGLRETRELKRLPECRAAILADGRYDWQTVCNALINHCERVPEFLLVTPNPDDVFPGGNGAVTVAAGAVTRFITRILRVRGGTHEPVFLGKPHAPIFRRHHASLERRAGRGIALDRVLMIGDSPASDIRGARAFGYRAALLLTGITAARHLPPPPDAVPDWIFEGY